MGASLGAKKKGGSGRGLHFDPESDKLWGKEYSFLSGGLVEKMDKLIDVSEAIENIWVYKCPLNTLQLTQVIFNHQFVVFETRTQWWSIEKNSQGIAMQRSKNLNWVRGHLRREARNTPVEVLSSDKGTKCVIDLLRFLEQGNELDRMYELLDENCKDFAKRIFDEFAAKKWHGKIIGAS